MRLSLLILALALAALAVEPNTEVIDFGDHFIPPAPRVSGGSVPDGTSMSRGFASSSGTIVVTNTSATPSAVFCSIPGISGTIIRDNVFTSSTSGKP